MGAVALQNTAKKRIEHDVQPKDLPRADVLQHPRGVRGAVHSLSRPTAHGGQPDDRARRATEARFKVAGARERGFHVADLHPCF